MSVIQPITEPSVVCFLLSLVEALSKPNGNSSSVANLLPLVNAKAKALLMATQEFIQQLFVVGTGRLRWPPPVVNFGSRWSGLQDLITVSYHVATAVLGTDPMPSR